MLEYEKQAMSDYQEVQNILMEQGYTWSDATLAIKEMRDRIVDDKEDPYEVLMDFGLEPDYLMGVL